MNIATPQRNDSQESRRSQEAHKVQGGSQGGQKVQKNPLVTFLDRRKAQRLRARRVRRLVRHIEPWSVLKMSIIFYLCLWGILLLAGVLLWRFAVTAGTVDALENFIKELFALEAFSFNADQIFRFSALGGLVLVVAGSGFTVLMTVVFNLISDLIGGVRLTVVEEETARLRPKRTRPRKKTDTRVVAQQEVMVNSNPGQGQQVRPSIGQASGRQQRAEPFWPNEKRKARKQQAKQARARRMSQR